MYFQKIILTTMWRVATGESMGLGLWGCEALGAVTFLCLLATPEIILFYPFQSLSSLEWVLVQSLTGFSTACLNLGRKKVEKTPERTGTRTFHFRCHSYPKVPFWNKLLRHQSKSGSQAAIPATRLPLFSLPNHGSPLHDPPISFVAHSNGPF